LAATIKYNGLDIPALLAKYEKSHKAEAEAIFTPYKNAPINDFVVPLMDVEVPIAGSTDVGDVSWVCPTVQAKIVCEVAGTPGHSWQLTSQMKSSYAHKGMLYAGKVMAATAIDMYESPETIEAAKNELNARLGGGKYECGIPKDIVPQAIKPKK
ncbi:MAG: amidohydrolase, partial [Lachnospiraceae bacterium]|nr:amidohydrolase [Lachnospiraceae bacterium]